eukprot:gene28618-37595_t
MPIDILELEGTTFKIDEENFNASSPGTLSSTGAQYGFDVSTTISSSSASCFVSSGYVFTVPRGYKSSGTVDTQVCTSLKAAYTAGVKVRDVYLFPCPTCSKSAATQMSELLSYLSSNCKTQWSGRVWLDIEGSSYWTGSTTNNKSWYKALVDSCTSLGVTCGVYASASQWSAIFGSTSYCYGNNLPLWYAHYDNNPSFSDFTTFGCWTSPHAKQYAGTTTVCSMGIDKNYATAF